MPVIRLRKQLIESVIQEGLSMNCGLSEKEIREHEGPLWSGNLVIEKVEGRWVPGGCPARVSDRQAFALQYGMSARKLVEKLGHIEDHPRKLSWLNS
nr:MAG TPA: hypothetical protein [Caudoviricetes sp.]